MGTGASELRLQHLNRASEITLSYFKCSDKVEWKPLLIHKKGGDVPRLSLQPTSSATSTADKMSNVFSIIVRLSTPNVSKSADKMSDTISIPSPQSMSPSQLYRSGLSLKSNIVAFWMLAILFSLHSFINAMCRYGIQKHDGNSNSP